MDILAPDLLLLFWTVACLVSILSLFALIDLLRSQFMNNDKLIWTMILLFVPIFGPLLYFTIGRKQKVKK